MKHDEQRLAQFLVVRRNPTRLFELLEGHMMTQILIVHGIGMNMRGKVQTDVFGTMTLQEYDKHINTYASELGVDVEIFHSNLEGEVINKFYEAHDNGVDAALINPAGYTTGHPALVAAIAQVGFPTIEVHVSNPARRGGVSEVARVSHGVVAGFGVFGYYLALRGVLNILGSQ
ncbi:Catabolic 3-dehydroquinase [Candidatus Entotheonellaceae bacterium PAL068K]